MKKPKVGDYITFTCTTRGSGKKKVRRQVVEVDDRMGVGVRYDGWSPFWVSAVGRFGDKIHKVEAVK